MQYYYTNQGDLVVTTTWQKDTISATTTNVCGEYSIIAELDSDQSTITAGGSVDSSVTKITSTDTS